MHGREGGDNPKRSRHMWSVPSSTTVTPGDSNGSLLTHFFKDGRKISVGDSALFKPPHDSPPFIGIIRSLTSVEESNLKLSVNWLYRPAEVKLGKGVAPEAVPNEVFYSFHSDEIPAASLLHPCKVAFLPKGVELAPGVSSFVCRRVYDIKHKCLWWLTDQDYIYDRQKEVDQLLYKTRIDMHTMAQQQQGARSPKVVNGSTATSPLKHSPDSVQNSSSNFSSQTKGKKRERGDQTSDTIKREWCSRGDDGESGQLRSESMLKVEIAKIADKGGLVDAETVEKLVQLMQPDKPERKIDLAGRSMIAGVIAATDKLDCLNLFVQRRGLPVLDEWLQEIHKGRVRDHGNAKDGDISVDNFLLVVLCALDKLPVTLNALQMCNIGKSVNHLRSHKNIEIQKKARFLVDTWKKRVEVEMSTNDTKSGSNQAVAWAARTRNDSPHCGNKHSSGSSETAIRSSVTHHLSLKSTTVKLLQGEPTSKSASACQAGVRTALSPTSTTAIIKDGQSQLFANGVSSELSQAVVKDEKCSSSNQSHSSSQCSVDHVKDMVHSGKEDARISTPGSKSLNKITVNSSKLRKSANDLHGTPTCGVQRETVPNRGTSVARISAVEKVSDNENSVDAGIHEATNDKLIVKIPNRGHSGAQNSIVETVDDYSCRNSSPICSEKHDPSDSNLREKHDPCPSDKVDSNSTLPLRTNSEIRRIRRLSTVSKAVSPPVNEMKPIKSVDPSFSSMNALVESCVKFSEANASMSIGDDAGMNLLASVAAEEISKSASVSPSVTSCQNSAAVENPCTSYDVNEKQLHGGSLIPQQCQPNGIVDTGKGNVIVSVSKVRDGEASNCSGTSSDIVHQSEEGCKKSNGKLGEQIGVASLPTSPACASGRSVADGSTETFNVRSISVEESVNQLQVASQGLDCSLAADDKIKEASLEQNSLAVALRTDSRSNNEMTAGQELTAEIKVGKVDAIDKCGHAGIENRRLGQETYCSKPLKHEDSGFSSIVKEQDANFMEENAENKKVLQHRPGPGFSAKQVSSSTIEQQKPEVHLSTKESDIISAEEERKDNIAPTGSAVLSPSAGGSDVDTKLGFDLNEGFSLDDGKNDEPFSSDRGSCQDNACSVGVLQSSGPPTSITVAAAAKGFFVPPDDLLRNKTEFGWKGSAATSAFRPAEPRKVMEVPLGSSKVPPSDAPACKPARVPLDFDLNVADERTLVDTSCQASGLESNNRNYSTCEATSSSRCFGGLDLDLNKVDENVDGTQCSPSKAQGLGFLTPVKASSSNLFSNGETSGWRDFDLNDGPGIEEMPVEKVSHNQLGQSCIPPESPFGPRISSSDTRNCFAWYPPGTSYAVSMMSSAIPDRHAFPIMGIGSDPRCVIGGQTPNLPFSPDSFKGSLSSPRPMPFHSTPFQYSPFPFGTSFPLPTSSLLGGSSGSIDPGQISAIPSQLVGTAAAAAVPFQYPHAYAVPRPIPDVCSNGVVENYQKWEKQGLDLNSGPRGVNAEGRDESLPTVSRQRSSISSQSPAEEQMRMYNIAGGVLKRKEPDGGWTADRFNFKQSPWQ